MPTQNHLFHAEKIQFSPLIHNKTTHYIQRTQTSFIQKKYIINLSLKKTGNSYETDVSAISSYYLTNYSVRHKKQHPSYWYNKKIMPYYNFSFRTAFTDLNLY